MKRAALALFLFLSLTAPFAAQTNIRKVDFKNFSYRLSCGSADRVTPIRVINGSYVGRKGRFADEVYFKITDVLFGDINGDGKEEAIVLYSCGSGASYVYFWGLVFGLKNQKPVLMTDVEGGNKGDGGLHDVKIVRNLLIVERYQLPVAGSPCCPEFIETTKYEMKGKKLVQIGKQTLRKVPAA